MPGDECPQYQGILPCRDAGERGGDPAVQRREVFIARGQDTGVDE
ncbi:MAG: hypothetical protein ABWY20_05170 [Mycobacterium sp.]